MGLGAVSLHDLGALVTMGLGVMALVRPSAAAAFTGIAPQGKIGVSEIRATYGGLFFMLGASALLFQQASIFTVVGLAWAGAAAGRVISLVVDSSRSSKNLGAVAFEAAVALLLLL